MAVTKPKEKQVDNYPIQKLFADMNTDGTKMKTVKALRQGVRALCFATRFIEKTFLNKKLVEKGSLSQMI